MYDTCIIGCGPAGYAAAIKSGVDFQKKTCIIEKSEHIGGAGIWNGALSSKTMWEVSSEWLKIMDPAPRGYSIKDATCYLRDVQRRVQNAVHAKEAQMRQQLEYFDIPLERGSATFKDRHTVVVRDNEGNEKEITAEYFVIATGSRPREHPKYKTDGKYIINSDHVQNMNDFPKSMVIIGAGVVGCEYATIFANFGQTRVNLVSKYKNILPFEDDDVSHTVSKIFEMKRINIHQGDVVDMKTITSMADPNGKRVEYTIKKPSGELESVVTDVAFFSIGRVPNLDGMGLEEIGVKFDKYGKLISRKGQTTVKNVYAVGDVTADIALVNMAELEGRQAIRNIYGNESHDINTDNLPYIFFVDPLVAAVGMNETECIKKRVSYKAAYYDYGLVSRAIAKKRSTGMIKLIVTNEEDPKKMKILGVRAMGPAASCVIEVIATTIGAGQSLHSLIVNTKTAYPAITEGLQECQRLLTGTSIYKPEVFPQYCRLKSVRFDDDDEDSSAED